MSKAIIKDIDTTLDTETLLFRGRAVLLSAQGGKVVACVERGGGYDGQNTTVVLNYLVSGGVCPSTEEYLGLSGGKAVFISSCVVSE